MMKMYVVFRYIESKDNSSVKMISGYTFILNIAKLYVATHSNLGRLSIVVIEGLSEHDIFDRLYNEYGYDLRYSKEMMIDIYNSRDGKYHIVDVMDDVETLMYETDLVDTMIKNGVQGYLSLLDITKYTKDKYIEPLLRYIVNISLRQLFEYFIDNEWCLKYDNHLTVDRYSLDIVSMLVINGYMTPIEHINLEDNSVD